MSMTTIFFTFLLLLLGLDFSTATSITIQPKKLDRSGDNVKIQWSGVPSPSPLDWIGIYSPPSSPDLNFLGYLYLNASPTWATGSGHLHLPLTNLRSPYQFRLFRWTKDQINPKHHDHNNNPLPGTTHRLAVSRDLHFANPNFPDQLHLSFADNHDEMRVMFVSGESSPAFVEYGLDESNLNHKTLTEAHTYDRTHMCDSPANSTTGWRSPGFTHEALLRNLANGKRYFYRVGNNTMGWTSIHSFISRDITSNQTIAYLFGDMGTFTPYKTYRRTQKESLSTVKWILRDIAASGDKPSLVSHIGDISYAQGYSWIWDQFFHQIEPIASSVPYHVCMGNHEYDWPLQPWKPSWSYGIYGKDGGGECGVPYSVRFHMPGGGSSIGGGGEGPKTRNIYYSFDEGVVHFLYMSTEMDFLPGSKQYEFIRRDLEGVDRKKTPYVVFQGHRPMYTTSTRFGDGPLRERMLEHLEPLLVENDVTLAMWGHVHLYERFCALRNHTCVDGAGGGPVHLVIGMAGKETQPMWTPLANQKEASIYPQPERSMYRGGQFGYVRLVATMEKLTVTYVGNHDGQPHDHVEIFSGHGDHSTPDGNDGDDHDDDDHDGDDGEGKGAVVSGFWSYVMYVGCAMFGAAVGYSLRFLVSPSSRRRMGTYKPIGDDGI